MKKGRFVPIRCELLKAKKVAGRFFLTFRAQRAGLFLALLVPAVSFAGTLDDYYLSRFHVSSTGEKTTSRALADAAPVQAERCRTMLHRNLKRDWDQLESTTQKVLGKYLGRPILSGQTTTSALTYTSSAGHFAVHYTNSGTDAPDLTDGNANGVPDWVEKVGSVFEAVYAAEVTSMGYRPPPVTTYDVYLMDLVPDQAYGYTMDDALVSTVSAKSYIEIDKAFTDPMFTVSGRYSPEQMLQVTAAHEFHHAIQFGYNYYFESWYAEVTSTWMEDEVYDTVNQNYSYIPSYLPHAATISLNGPLDGASEYGRWIFNRYVAEKHGTGEVVHGVWERFANLRPGTSPTTTSGDIQMTPVIDSVLSTSYGSTLAADYLGFAKRAYARNWTTHTGDTALIPRHTNAATYSSYPVASTTVTLPRYSFAFYKFAPSSSAPTLNIIVSNSSGMQTALYKKVGGVVSEVAANSGGNAYSVTGFGSSDEVVLVVANTSASDNLQTTFRTVTDLYPGAPAITSVKAGNTYATVYFAPPTSTGASAVTGYTVTSSPGGVVASGTASPIVVGSLQNDTAYTFTVAAANSYGSGPASAPSSAVTPSATAAALPGDCDGTGSVTIAEVQTAINMFLGISAVRTCVDLDDSKAVSIAEVQKVINSFLGL